MIGSVFSFFCINTPKTLFVNLFFSPIKRRFQATASAGRKACPNCPFNFNGAAREGLAATASLRHMPCRVVARLAATAHWRGATRAGKALVFRPAASL